MDLKRKILPLKGVVQHYDWGGKTYIPELLGVYNPDNKPFAEYWMGAHAKAPSTVVFAEGQNGLLNDLVKADPVLFLGKEVFEKFETFPYLFKVLDVEKMLSIQVHPSKDAAILGFEKEEAAGISIDAPNRNYKDKNHKPEVMVALSDFWLLHGFKPESELSGVLKTVPEFSSLVAVFENEGYSGLYRKVMEMPAADADEILLPLVKNAVESEQLKSSPGFWIKKWYEAEIPTENIDRGIFSIYFFNIVNLMPGQAIFQGAGVPHAYLQGINIELMANSDNVLRGGLTTKYIDVPELLSHIVFEGIEPQILNGEKQGVVTNYPLPTEDFGISSLFLTGGDELTTHAKSPEIYLVLNGSAAVDNIEFKRGECFYVLPGADVSIKGIGKAEIFRAFVP